MSDPRLEDHAVGVELQLTELTEELDRAWAHGFPDRARELEAEIAALHDDLAATAEKIVGAHYPDAEIHTEHAG